MSTIDTPPVRQQWPGVATLPLSGAAGFIAGGGLLVLLLLFGLTATNALGQAALWENAHWTVSVLVATPLAYLGYRRAPPEERVARGGIALGVFLYLVGQVAWDLQIVFDVLTVPAVSDVFFLGSVVPIVLGLTHAFRSRLSPAERTAFGIDAATVTALVTLIVVAGYGSTALITAAPLAGVVLLLYPIAFVSASGIGALGGLQLRIAPAWLGINALLGGLAVNGVAWVIWVQHAVTAFPAPGAAVNYVFSLAFWSIGVGSYRLCLTRRGSPAFSRFAEAGIVFFPMVAAATALGAIIVVDRLELAAVHDWVQAGAAIVVALSLVRQSVLLVDRRRVAEREHALSSAERDARRQAEASLLAQAASETRYREVVEVFGHLGEQLSFAAEEEVLVRGGVAAMRRLVSTTGGDLLLANASQDRLVVAASWGDSAPPVGQMADDVSPVRCLGIRRGSVYAVSDLSDDLMLPCPAHPSRRGSLLCVPMLALGRTIGTVHLESSETDAFTTDDELQAGRVAEQVALAIANTRLVKTLESMALTDQLTHLHNARFFDPFLDRELATAVRDEEPLAVIMIDIDHFKQFNDTHGHPSGDEALKAFASAVLSVARDSDTVARYGGEEFVIAARHSDLDGGVDLAERIRQVVERTPVELGPDRLTRITASFGVASTASHGTDRLTLMKAADEALYRAKHNGRNRVEAATAPAKSRVRRLGRRPPQRTAI